MLDFRGNLEGAQHGDEEAFARLWREFQPGLLRYLRIKAAPVAEDLAADIWVRVLRALPGFEGDEQGFRGWLYTTARNRLTDWYRSGERRIDVIEHASLIVLPSATNVEEEAAENSATDRAIALIGELPPDQAEAVMLRIVAGMDVARVASIMGRTPGSIRVLCHRGLRRLEQRLGEVVAAETVAVEIPDVRSGTVGAGSTTVAVRCSATVPARTEERLHA
jgi:RNA polymerase sigma-70 factor, ECF subfamily